MKFIVTWKLQSATSLAAIDRFLAGGAAPPEGVRILGRWHGANMSGVAIVEAVDAAAVYRLSSDWWDLLSIEVTPCVDDAEAGPILVALQKARS
ncbi:MAG: DUF3303 domain-containing protein [Acidobacteria bacterium]|nr:DUF3303 domain-containing protein [Acidobacteriota bacterium]